MTLYDKKLSNDYVKNRDSYTNTDERVFECIKSFGNVTGKKVLDLGYGNGRYSKKFADMGAHKVIGIDVSPEMIVLAKENKFSNIDFIEASATELPLKDEEFDFIFSNFVLHHVKGIRNAFEEIWRVLKKMVFWLQHLILTISNQIMKIFITQKFL